MLYVIFYGCLALAVLCLSIAPATRTLWKLGVMFFCNWIFCTFINISGNEQVNAVGGILIDCLSVFVCFTVYFRHYCGLANACLWIYLVQIGINVWYIFNQDYTYTMVFLNSLFILNAILICSASVHKLHEKRKDHSLNKDTTNNGSNLPFIGWRY